MSGVDVYKKTAVTTQTPGQLVVMLYEGAIRYLRGMLEAIGRNDSQLLAERGHKAAAIINELDASLDTSAGGDIAQQLRSLYGFCRQQTMRGQIRKESKAIEDVIVVLEDLLKGWRVVAN